MFDASYTHSTYTTLWGIGDSPGMQDLIATMREYAPDNIADDVYIISWIEGLIAQHVIENAIDNGDITRAGMVASANEITVDLQGLAPNQNWGVEANDAIVRGTYLYDVDLAAFTPDGTVSDDDANRGFTRSSRTMSALTPPPGSTSPASRLPEPEAIGVTSLDVVTH